MSKEIARHTIAAIATPLGEGGIGVIRVSGPDTANILDTLSGLKDVTPRYFYVAALTHPSTSDILDEAGWLFFKGPHSYTGEDVLEIHLHSSPFVMKSVLEAVLECGAELASPGEFTRRAFVNGKLDLTKAESVIDLIHSRTQKSHSVALSHLQGGLYARLMSSRGLFMTMLEQVEASIDFPDEVEPIDKPQMVADLVSEQSLISKILELGDYGPLIRSGVKVLIVGQPNVGKSSLMNALLGQDRAIVTDIAGTTRDFITESIELGGVHFHLYDTAGIRDSSDYIEQLGMEKISELLDSANIILLTLDSSVPFSPEDHSVLDKLPPDKLKVLILNKSDQKQHLDPSAVSQLKDIPSIALSAQTGDGIDELKSFLYEQFVAGLDDVDVDLLCNARQLSCLKNISSTLTVLLDNISNGVEDDLLSIDLKRVIQQLGELTGDEVTEEVLDGIFSRFCVGK